MNEKRLYELRLSDNVITSDSDFFTLSGGMVSGDMTILSGNYIQTTDLETTRNYSDRNAFLQAEAAPGYGYSTIGTKAFCILSVDKPNNRIKLSGDSNSLSVLGGILDGSVRFSDLFPNGYKSKSIKRVIGHGDGNISDDYPLSDSMFSLALDSSSISMKLKVLSVDGNWVTFRDQLSSYLTGDYSTKTESEMEEMWNNDDNAFYLLGFPDVGNQICKNFYAQHLEGGSVRAVGKYSHVEGRDGMADVRYSHAEGSHCVAGELASHAEGFNTYADGRYSHSEGDRTEALGRSSHAEGQFSIANGNYSHAEGYQTSAIGMLTHAEGYKSYAGKHSGSHAEGGYYISDNNNVVGGICKENSYGSHAEGLSTLVDNAVGAHAEGCGSTAKGNGSHAEGGYWKSSSPYIEGGTYAGGKASHSEGAFTSAMNYADHSEGLYTIANGAKKGTEQGAAHAEGNQTSALAPYSHAQGTHSVARGQASFAAGYWNETVNDFSIAMGVNATADKKYAFVWSGDGKGGKFSTNYHAQADESFNINPKLGIDGFFIGTKNLRQLVATRDELSGAFDSAKGMYEGFIGNACLALSAAGAIQIKSGTEKYETTQKFDMALATAIMGNAQTSCFFAGCAALISAIALAGSKED